MTPLGASSAHACSRHGTAAGRDDRPPGASESVPTLGTWLLLYDLASDPAEAYNVASHHPEVAGELAEQLRAWHDAFRANPRGWR